MDILHSDLDKQIQEGKLILFSKDQAYEEKRTAFRKKKWQVIQLLLFSSAIIMLLSALYSKVLPHIPIKAIQNIVTDENTLIVTSAVIAAKLAIMFALILAFSRMLFIGLQLVLGIFKMIIVIVKQVLHILKIIVNAVSGKRIKLPKDGFCNDKGEDTQYTNEENEPRKSKSEMELLMRKQLEFGLDQYGLLFNEEAPKKGIEISNVIKGPTITRYQITKNDILVKDIKNKLQDLEITMEVQNVKLTNEEGRLYLEVANLPEAREIVLFSAIYEEFNNTRKNDNPLVIPIGVTATGELLIVDIRSFPHLLIAGSTGSGKSVCGNEIICSLLLNADPQRVKLILIDPKRVELSQYKDIPHLMQPIAKDIKEIKQAMSFLIKEMERRYIVLEEAGCKDIERYHSKGNEMPYIVAFFDELADVIIQDRNFIEESIMRLVGKARAAGIHMIIATQRPSADVLTGIIKANLPATMAFMTTSDVNSRVILGQNGAEKLLGRGDGLLSLPDRAKLTRFQGAFIKDDEIEIIIESVIKLYGGAKASTPKVKIVKPINAQAEESEYRAEIIETTDTSSEIGSDENDEYLEEAIELVIQTKAASVSMLQRKFRVGYNRAARMIDEMERRGVVGPLQGSKERIVLITHEEIQEVEEIESKELEKETTIFEDIDESVDRQLLSFICKEKVRGETVLPSTTEIVKLLKRRKSEILESINHLIDRRYVIREGGGKYTKIMISISREDAIRYLFYNDIDSYEEVKSDIEDENRAVVK